VKVIRERIGDWERVCLVCERRITVFRKS